MRNLLFLLFLAMTFIVNAQTQYVGPANGNWFTAANWNNGLPATGNDALVGGGISVVIDQPLTAGFTITNFGTLTSAFAITVNSTFSNSGTLTLTNGGSILNNGTFQNFGSTTLSGNASFTNEAAGTFTNGGPFTMASTLLNKGAITNNGSINALNGTLQTDGSFQNNSTLETSSLTVSLGSLFTNNQGANVKLTGTTSNLRVFGEMTNSGTITLEGTSVVDGKINNFASFINAGNFRLNAAGEFNGVGGLVTNTGSMNLLGKTTNGFQWMNKGTINASGAFVNSNLLTNDTGATFTFSGPFDMGFGSRISNLGTFNAQGDFKSFGTIENNKTFVNSGTITNFSGSTLNNLDAFTNNGTILTANAVSNTGVFRNSGKLTISNGSVWTNSGNFINNSGGEVTNLQDLNNVTGSLFTNNGRFINVVRISQEGNATNNGFIENQGDITLSSTGRITNRGLFLLIAGNIKNGGTLRNEDRLVVDECSSISNTAQLTNVAPGVLTLNGILFQRGTYSGAAVTNQGGYIHTTATSNAPAICKTGRFGANAEGEIKVYAQELVAFTTFDSCANIIYRANGLPRPLFGCSDIGTNVSINLSLRTRIGDSLTCTTPIIVEDKLEPFVENCPKDIIVYTSNATATATWTAPTATDNCSAVTRTVSNQPGSSFNVGITGVTYSFKDASGNENVCQFRVDVRRIPAGAGCANDVTAPVFSNCPANISVTSTGGSLPVTWTIPTVTDGCLPLSLTSNFTPGTMFPVGTTRVTYTARDGNGRTSTCGFNVTVTVVNNACTNDQVAPVFSSCPPNIVVPINTVIGGGLAYWVAPSVGDNCSAPTVTASHVPGSVFPAGATTVTYTAKDAKNNTAVCSFIVTVGVSPCPNDVTGPVFSNCPANRTVLAAANGLAVVTWTAPTVTDPCTPLSVYSNYTSGAAFPIGTTTVTYTASDAKGNVSTCKFDIVVTTPCGNDTQNPVISGCPADITVAAVNGGGVATWTAPTATDNCGLVNFSSSYAPGATFPVGTTIVAYGAIDLSGNIATCEFKVTVVTAPGCATPSAPINATANVNPASVTLTWNNVTTATNYDIYLGTANPPTTIVAANVTGTSRVVTGLQPGTVYYWYVTPKNQAGAATGCQTNTIRFTTANAGNNACNRNVLFVVGTTALNTSDAAVKSRLETLGYTVSLVDDDVSATSDATGKGLVIISSTCLSTNVNTKYRDIAIPVINWEGWLMDDMKMTGTVANTDYGLEANQTQLVVQGTGPLSANLTGTQTVFNVANTMTWGKPGAAATKIGLIPTDRSKVAYFAYDAGAAMVGMTAPAKRIGFFLENDNAHQFSSAGTALFDAAVLWATGCPDCRVPVAKCKNLSLQLTAPGQSVQISGVQMNNGSEAGCGATITSLNASITSFSQAGTFPVTLTVTNSLGLSSTCQSIITVVAAQVVTCTGNLLSNSGFENNFTGYWTNGAVTTVADANSGTKAANICTTTGGAGQIVPATAGRVYTLQAATKISGAPSWASIGITFFDANYVKIGNDIFDRVQNSSYQTKTVSGTAPANTAFVGVFFWKNDGGCLFVDDYCLTAPSVVEDPCVAPGNGLTQEIWTGIGGVELSNLINHPNYPSRPNTTIVQPTSVSRWDIMDNYGTRTRGFIVPDVTSDYTFYLTGDDETEMYLSSNALAANKTKVAFVPGWTSITEYYKYPQQKTATVRLLRGVKYYLEVLNKEGGGGDGFGVYWTYTGVGISPIPNQCLQPYDVSCGNTGPVACNISLGSITREIWNVNNWNFNVLDNGSIPDVTQTLNGNFELTSPENGSNYTDRVRGFLVPQATGTYYFNVTGDDFVELYIGTTANPSSKVKVAFHVGWTAQNEFTKYPTQTSGAVQLTAGKTYYIELRHLEGGGGDHFKASWKTPSNSNWVAIPTSRLAPWTGCIPSSVTDNVLLDRADVSEEMAEETAIQKSIKVFPNPVSNVLTVQLPEMQGQKASVQLMDMQGRVFEKVETAENQLEINVQHLFNGAYILIVRKGDFTAHEKVIIAH